MGGIRFLIFRFRPDVWWHPGTDSERFGSAWELPTMRDHFFGSPWSEDHSVFGSILGASNS